MCGQKGLRHFWRIWPLADTDFCRLSANISKTVNRSVTCQHQLDDRFLKCKSRGDSPHRSHYMLYVIMCVASMSIFVAESVISEIPLMRGRAAFVYSASTVDTIGRMPSKC